jgi:putative peptidoglycan lipid II flippase
VRGGRALDGSRAGSAVQGEGGQARPDLRQARVVAAGLLVSKPAGYVRDALLAARFGTGPAMDAFVLASGVATAAAQVLATPLQRMLVPVLVRARTERGPAGLEATAGAVLGACVAVGLALGLLLVLGAGPLAALLAGDGLRGPVAHLIRWLAPLPLATALAGYAAGWLQAGEHFALPAFAGVPFDLGIIGCVALLPQLGVLATAWGLVLGTLGQYALQWPGLRRWGHRVRLPAGPAQALSDPGLATMAGMAVPLLVSAAAAQGATLLPQALAARAAPGTVAALGYAMRVLDLPAALFILPVATVALPRLSRLHAAGQAEAAAEALGETAWALAAALVPCALLVALLAPSLSAALYQHGAFGTRSVGAMAAALAGFAPGVLTWGMQQLLRTFFYAREDAGTPMRWDLAALGATAAFDLGLVRGLGGFGLALGWSAGAAVGWGGLVWAARVARPGRAWPYARALGAGALALVAAVLALRGHVPAALGPAGWRAGLFDVAVRGLAGGTAYVLAVVATGGRPMLEELAGRVRARLAGVAGPSPQGQP